MEKAQKDVIIQDLAARLAEVHTVIVTDFQGLDVSKMGALRKKVYGADASYQVVKNTLLRKAAKGTPAETLTPMFVGNNAVASTTKDSVALAKLLINFAKDNDKFIIKGGMLNGKQIGLDQIKALSDLPSKEVLLATMLGALNAVPTGLVRVLNGVPAKLVYALSAIKDQKEAVAN